MQKVKKFFKKLWQITPLWSKIAYILGAVSVVLYVTFIFSPSFADFFNRYPAAFLRAALAKISGFLPVSIAETVVMLLPLIIVIVIIKMFKAAKGELKDTARMLICTASVLALFFSSFTLLFASGYRGSTLDEKLGLPRTSVSAAELHDTAKILNSELEKLIPELTFNTNKGTVMPYSFFEMNDHLQDAYKKAAKKYDFLPSFTSTIKPVILSEPMTYTHIAGIYTFFTGESNINTNFPDYTLPFTAAHELAHQRGIAREDEANFVAFLVCIESDDPYIRYSGYMSVYEYVLSALYQADQKAYSSMLKETSSFLISEIQAYNEFFEKYRDNVVANVSGSVNNGYLQSQGQSAGSKSYGMVVDLAVAYYKARLNSPS